MRKFLLGLLFSLIASSAVAQTVQQSGSVTFGHVPSFVTSGIIQDGGTTSNPQINALGIYGSGGTPFGILSTSQPGTPTGTYARLGFGISNSAATISVTPLGGLGPIPLNFNIAGATPLQLTSTSVIIPSGISFSLPSGSIALASLANIPAQTLLGNATGSTGSVTSAYTVSSASSTLIPAATGSFTQNDVACFADGNGTIKDCGSATAGVTNVATGAGLTGGPITSTGTISTTGVLADLAGVSFSQGDLIYYDGTGHLTNLGHGTTGQLLSTGGASANPSWVTASGTGTVTSVATGTGLTGGTITASGTISLAAITSHDLLANITGGSAAPTANTLTAVIDAAISSTQGGILERGSSTWGTIGPGGAGTLLQGVAASNDPAFTVTPTLGISGTSTGTLALAGATSGAVTVQPQAAAGTWNFNLPTTAGSAGQVLTSQGGGTNAMTWGTAGGLSQINVQAFASSGTYTPTSGMKYVVVYAWGAGGGSGGGSNGGAGGDTSLGSLLVAKGGGGGSTTGGGGPGGAAGSGTGTILISGQAGGAGTSFTDGGAQLNATGGYGGGSPSMSPSIPQTVNAGAIAGALPGQGAAGSIGSGTGAGGGGGGGLAISSFSAATIGSSQTVTIGAGGSAGGAAGFKGYMYMVEYQ